MRLAKLIASIALATSAPCTDRMTYAYGAHVTSRSETMTRVIEILGEPFSKESI